MTEPRERQNYSSGLNQTDEIPVARMKDVIGTNIDVTAPTDVEEVSLEDILGEDINVDELINETKDNRHESVLRIPPKDQIKNIIGNTSSIPTQPPLDDGTGTPIEESEEEDNVFFIKK
jgi:hypothetical protein